MGCYEALVARVTAEGVEIVNHARIAANDPRGEFDRKWNVIRVYHSERWDRVDDIPDSCTLAHEFGHWRSFKAGQQSARYHEIIDREDVGPGPGEFGAGLNEQDKALVIDEEARAWDYGRQELEAIGFAAWEVFDREREDSLAEYRRRLDPSCGR